MRLVTSMLIVIALASAAIGQSPTPSVKTNKLDPADIRALAARYELTNADATRRCPTALETRPAGPGLFLAFDRKQCSPLFGFLGEVAAWLPGIAGAILFVGPDGRTVAEFTEGVGGVYEAIRENNGVYFLVNLQFVDPAERVQITDLFGDWNLSRPDAASLCRITLSDEIAGEETFVVRVQPKCDAAILRFGPASWQLDRGDVVLRSKNGEQLRFERQEGGVWAKIPDRPRPLLMTRP